MQHFLFFFLSVSSLGCRDSSRFFSSLKISSNNSLILILFLADVSRYFTFHIFCKMKEFSLFILINLLQKCTSRAAPVLAETCLLPASSSHLFPTSRTGQPSKLPFTYKCLEFSVAKATLELALSVRSFVRLSVTLVKSTVNQFNFVINQL